MSGLPFTKLTDPIQSANDTRTYRHLRLPNQLEALLVSDPDTDNAAAALDVRVGSLFDPPTIHGLAHFCEHMVFLGTDKYPSENEYNRYLSEHGGHSNAYTGLENTNYYFEVAHDALEGALDRFAQFFVAPRFDASCTERELLAVDSEHRKNLQSDGWRDYQIERTLANPAHPYASFSTGNVETLKTRPAAVGVDVRDALLDFHSKYYSANIMRLVVIGREPLDQLAEWTVNMFSEVPDKGIPPPITTGHPYTQKELQREVRIRSVKDNRSLEIAWPIRDQSTFYLTQPERYLTHLLGHEGGGSILSALKKKGWANYLSAGCSGGATGFDFLKVAIDLTEDGLVHYEDVVEEVFRYLRLIAADGINPTIFEEVKGLAELRFRFQEKSPASSYASRVAGLMQLPYAPEHLLSGPSLVTKYDESLLRSSLTELSPDRFWITLKGQRIPLGEAPQKEEWYGTEYAVHPLPSSLSSALTRISSGEDHGDPDLHVPRPNPFIPTHFDTAKPASGEPLPTPRKYPLLLEDSDKCRLWHKRDDQFWVPKVYVWSLIRSPLAYATPRTSVLTRLYAELVKDGLNEYSYDAEVAGLSWSLSTDVDGLVLSLEGYNDRMPVLLERVIAALRDFRISPARFTLIHEQLLRMYGNFDKEAPYQHAVYHLSSLTQERMWTHQEKLAEVRSIQDPAEVEAFARDFLLRQLHVETLIAGNASVEEARAWSTSMVQGLGEFSPLFPNQRAGMRSVVLPTPVVAAAAEGSATAPAPTRFTYRRTVEAAEEVNSAIEWYVQVGDARDRRTVATVALIAQLAQEPCFDQLRTKEQLGYLVFSSAKLNSASIGFRIIVQSARSADYVEGRIESFLQSLAATIEALSPAEWDRHVSALISRKTERDKHLQQEATRYWDHIHSGFYDFAQVDAEVPILRSLQKADVLALYRARVDPASPLLRKIAVHMEVHAKEEASKGDADAEADAKVTEDEGQVEAQIITPHGIESVLIESPQEWKGSMTLGAAPSPIDAKFMKVVGKGDPKL